MEFLKQIFYKLKLADKEKRSKKYHFRPERPTKEVQFVEPNIPASHKDKSQREMLSKVLAVIYLQQHLRFSDGITVVPLSTTNKKLISIFGSPRNVSRGIRYMIDRGLIALYDDTFQFNAYYEKLNRCKTYAWNYEAEQFIAEYCKANDINKFEISNVKHHRKTDYERPTTFEEAQVLFSSHRHLTKPDNWSTAEFEEYASVVLEENYPLLRYFQKKADKINSSIENPLLKVQFTPTFTWGGHNKYLKKIGIRATNGVVSYKKEKEEDDRPGIMYRQDLLDKTGCIYEYDVKSSVPRVTDALNKGKWNSDNSHDFYYDVWLNYIKNNPSDEMPWDEDARKVIKSLFMRGYFDSEETVGLHTKYALSKKGGYKKDEWNFVDETMTNFQKAIVDTLGSTYGSEIFFHESCIYMMVLEELLNRGIKVVQIYDGFYTDKPVEDMNELIEKCANEYLEMIGIEEVEEVSAIELADRVYATVKKQEVELAQQIEELPQKVELKPQ